MYTGEFKEGDMSGEGRRVYVDGTCYEGGWEVTSYSILCICACTYVCTHMRVCVCGSAYEGVMFFFLYICDSSCTKEASSGVL